MDDVRTLGGGGGMGDKHKIYIYEPARMAETISTGTENFDAVTFQIRRDDPENATIITYPCPRKSPLANNNWPLCPSSRSLQSYRSTRDRVISGAQLRCIFFTIKYTYAGTPMIYRDPGFIFVKNTGHFCWTFKCFNKLT